jgi:hypothetical protein
MCVRGKVLRWEGVEVTAWCRKPGKVENAQRINAQPTNAQPTNEKTADARDEHRRPMKQRLL